MRRGLLLALILAFALFPAWAAADVAHDINRLRVHGVDATAEVTDVYKLKRRSYWRVRLTVDGRVVSTRAGDPVPKVGDSVAVRYDPGGSTYLASEQPGWGEVWLWSSVAAGLVLFGLFVFTRVSAKPPQ